MISAEARDQESQREYAAVQEHLLSLMNQLATNAQMQVPGVR
jgi:hypothetical protein